MLLCNIKGQLGVRGGTRPVVGEEGGGGVSLDWRVPTLPCVNTAGRTGGHQRWTHCSTPPH